MTNHPNRSRRSNPAATPSPDEIRAARESAGLTREQAAALVYATPRAWQEWELGNRRLHPAIWELWQLKIGAKKKCGAQPA